MHNSEPITITNEGNSSQNTHEVLTNDYYVTSRREGYKFLEAILLFCGGMTFYYKETKTAGLIHFPPYDTTEEVRDKICTVLYQLKARGISKADLKIRAFMLSEETEKNMKQVMREQGLEAPEIESLQPNEHASSFPLKFDLDTGKVC